MTLLSLNAARVAAATGAPSSQPLPGGSPSDLEALSGRLVEVCALGPSGRLSWLSGLFWEAQERSEPAAWVGGLAGACYPPDLAAAGVCLDTLVTVRLADSRSIIRAAEHLARSGAFALIAVDLPPGASVPAPMLTRLSGLAQKHNTALVFLTEKSPDDPSLSSLISLRMQTGKCRVSDGRFLCMGEAIKDKRRGPGWTHEALHHGPAGLR